MATLDEEKRKLTPQEFSRLTSISLPPVGAVGGPAVVGGVPERKPAVQPAVSLPPYRASRAESAAALKTIPQRQPAIQPARPAVQPTKTQPTDYSPTASEARIRAVANEGRVPDRRSAPPVVEQPAAQSNRAYFTDRPEGGRSAFAPNIEGTDRTGFAATPQEMQRYQEYRAAQQPTANDAYQSALQDTALSSGDTWFNFMQKNQQRAAIIAARKSALEGEKLASAERMQERRGAIEAGLQGERLGAEAGLQQQRLTAAEQEAQRQRDFETPFKQATMRSNEADIGYKGALGQEAMSRGELAKIKVEEAKQVQALQKEYADPNTAPERRNRIAQILQGGATQKAELPGILKSMLETTDPKEHQKLVEAYATATRAASDPSSRYYGSPEGAFAELLGVVQQPQGDTTYAQGGVVDAQGYAQGGAIGPQQFGGLPEVDETATLAQMYTQYAQTTQAMGATPVDFNKFSTLMTTVRDRMAVPAQDPSAMGMPGYAHGGAVDVSGRQVFGPGTETSDSIPAVIDGQTPAALSTNEFVWTANATEAASPAVLKAVMTGLERNDPEIVSGIMALAAKAVKKPAQPAME